MSGRTPSSILRGKRAAGQEGGGGDKRRRMRSLSGRRVSFAPDDELETMHLFTDKNTPSPLPQPGGGDTQPLGELQNLVHQAAAGAAYGSAQQQPAFEKPPVRFESASPAFSGGGAAGAAAAAASPGVPFSPMSMDLTNDTLQQDAAAAAAAAAARASATPAGGAGAYPGADLSLTLDDAGAAAGMDATFNITDSVPGLSTLIEEDEEAFAAEAGGAGGAADEEEEEEPAAPDATAEMELTGGVTAEVVAPAGTAMNMPSPSPARYNTRRASSRGAAAAPDTVVLSVAVAEAEAATAAAAATTPVGSARRRSSRGAAAPAAPLSPAPMIALDSPAPASAANSVPAKSPARAASAAPKSPARTPASAARSAKSPAKTPLSAARSTGAATEAAAPSPAAAATPASVARSAGAAALSAKSPAATGGAAASAAQTPGSVSRAATRSAAKSPAAAPASARGSVSPSPLRRSTRRSTGRTPSPLPAAMQLQPVPEEVAPADAAPAAPEAEEQQPDAEAAGMAADEVAPAPGSPELGAMPPAAADDDENQAEEPAAGGDMPSPLPLSPVGAGSSSGGAGTRSGSSLGLGQDPVDTEALRNKWGFVPGDEDNTMALSLDRHGLGGLGEATLHAVYADHTDTNEVPSELRSCAGHAAPALSMPAPAVSDAATARAPVVAFAVAPPSVHSAAPAAATGRVTRGRRSSIAVAPQLSAIAESSDAPASPAASAGAAAADAAVRHLAAEAEASAAAGDGSDFGGFGGSAGRDAIETDGLTTKLMKIMGQQPESEGADDNTPAAEQEEEAEQAAEEAPVQDEDMAEAPAAEGALPTPEKAGSVAAVAAAPTPAAPEVGEDATLPRISIGGGRGSVGSNMLGITAGHGGATHTLGGAAVAAAGATTRLLADSLELGAVAVGGAAAAVAAAAAARPAGSGSAGGDDLGFTTNLLADATGASAFVPLRTSRGASLGAAAAGLLAGSPVGAAAPAAPAAGRSSLGLMAGRASVAAAGLGGDDDTLANFAAPPELGTGTLLGFGRRSSAAMAMVPGIALTPAASQGTAGRRPAMSEDRGGATMPFSGALSHPLSGALTPAGAASARGGGPHAQPITFQDFLQIVDMQFLDHIRRGTSINMMDLAPGPVPNDLSEALKALALTGPDVSVLETALTDVHAMMRGKRSQVHALEEDLEAVNPGVFSSVQTARRTELEGMKHALVIRKKCCRAETGAAWKRLRAGMERKLAEQLAAQQGRLDEELAFVQNKLQRAQQQRQLVANFAADIQKSIEAEIANHEAATAAQARLCYARARLEELRAINGDRQRRADEAAAEAARLQDECAKLAAARTETQAEVDRLSAAANAPTPARGEPSADRLIDAGERLDILSGLQPWRLKAAAVTEGAEGSGWLLRFRMGLVCRLTVTGQEAAVEVAVEAPAGGTPALQTSVLKQLAATLPARRTLPVRRVRAELPPLALRLDRMASLAEHLGRAFVAWRPLAGARVEGGSLVLVFVDALRGAKVEVGLGLDALLDRRPGAAMEPSLRVVAAPACWADAADAARAALASALADGPCAGEAVDDACASVARLLQQAPPVTEAAAAPEAVVAAAPAAVTLAA